MRNLASDHKRLEFYLLLGQSNMAGRGLLQEADRRPAKNILVFNKEDRWVSQGEPIHFDSKAAGVGLGYAFAKQRVDQNPFIRIGLIPCAVGGSPISKWIRGAPLYEESIRRARLALNGDVLSGFLWHQGEENSLEEKESNGYAQSLADIVSAYRDDLDAPEVPFIAGELGRFLHDNPKTPFARDITLQIHSLSKQLRNFAVVSSEGLSHGGDKVHFDAASLKEFGRRYSDVVAPFLAQPLSHISKTELSS